MNRTFLLLIIFSVSFSWGRDLTAAQEVLRPGRLPREVRRALLPGLSVTFQGLGNQSKVSDSRQSRLAALLVPSGTSPTSLLAAGPFQATMDGYLKLKLKGQYVFSARGSGEVRLWLNDQLILEDFASQQSGFVSLVKGYNKLRLEYKSPTSGDAFLRIYWTNGGFRTEPLSPIDLFYNSEEPNIRRGTQFRLGRQLLATHHCLKCHSGPDILNDVNSTMPELTQTAPDLSGIGARLSVDWMASWILDPQAMRTNVTMPAVLHHLDEKTAASQAADIAAYLSTLGNSPPASVSNSDEALLERGEILFEDLGCIACHRYGEAAEEDDYRRTTLHFVGAKFQSGALIKFLQNPRAHYPWSRMPDFHLSQDESAALVAFIRENSKGKISPIGNDENRQKGSIERGRKLLFSTGCLECHTLKDRKPEVFKAPTIKELQTNHGCLAEDKNLVGKAPDFGFSAESRSALQAFLKSDLSSLNRRSTAEASLRMVKQLRCTTCHQRDADYSTWPEIMLDEGSRGLPPEIVPSLTWAGEKILPHWSVPFISGKFSSRTRPWLRVRMPSFPARAKYLAPGLTAEHGFPLAEVDHPQDQPDLVEIGDRLARKDGGLHCFQCHGLGSTEPKEAFDIRGVNFSFSAARLRYEYYRRWMTNPLRIDPSTKMPKFAQNGTTTAVKHIFDGDSEKQFTALWHYLRSVTRKQTYPPD